MPNYGAFRPEIVNISPVDICKTCPQRGQCEGPAVQAEDNYAQTVWFTVSEIKGEEFAFRKYIDANGGTSEMFLTSDEELVRNCTGPETTKGHLFKPNEMECAVNGLMRRGFERRALLGRKRDMQRWDKLVFVTQEDISDVRQLSEADQIELFSLSPTEFTNLVVFTRDHKDNPEMLQALRQLKEAKTEN